MPRAARSTTAAVAIATAFGLTCLSCLTACGSSGGEQVGAGEKQTLTVWGMGAEGEKLGDVAKQYEKAHPNITIKVTPVGWDVAHQKLVSAAAAGTLPDVVQMGGTFIGEFVDLGALEPVDTKTFHAKDFFPAGWQQGVVDGKAYGVPWYVDVRALYYRTDLAKRAGITRPPASWPELKKDAAAFQHKAHTKWGLQLQAGGLDTVQNFYPFLYSAGGAIVDGNDKVAIDKPASVRAVKEYASYFSAGLASRRIQPGYDVTKDFNSGDVPMFFSGPWTMSLLKDQYPDLDGKWKVAKVPADKASVSMAGGSSLVVSKDSSHKAAAKQFIAALTGTEGQTDWFRRTSDLPANTSAWQAGELAGNADLQVFRSQLTNAVSAPTLPQWTEISSKVDSAIESVTQGKASPQAAFDKAASDIDGLVK